MASKSIDKIIEEIVGLGFSERKILNKLKEIKSDLINHDILDNENTKESNKLINSLLFDGSFMIKYPSSPLLGYVKKLKLQFGSKCVYYILSNILMSDYFYNGYYEKNDIEKSNFLMYHIKEKLSNLIIDYNNSLREIEEP